MFPVQMANNSFDYSESAMPRTEAPENLHERETFANVYDSVSSKTVRKPEDNNAKKDKFPEKEDQKKVIGDETQLSSKKAKPAKTVKRTKAVNSRALREKLAELSLLDSPQKEIKKHSSNIENKVIDKPEEILFPGHEIPGLDKSDFTKSEGIDNAVHSSEILISEQSKLNGMISSVNKGKSVKLNNKVEEGSSKKSNMKEKRAVKQTKISVLDLRGSVHDPLKIVQAKTKNTVSELPVDGQKLPDDQLEQIRSDSNEAAKPIVVELTHVKDNFSGESKTLTTTTGSALMKQLEESVNNKIVKQSNIVLKDDNSGEIRLILKPEALGKVRIRINLNDNRISGQVIVENAAVKDIFEQNLQNLERAFKEDGFDTAALNVSVGGDGSGSGDREKNGDIAKQIEMIDEIIPTMIRESENLIDLIA